MLILANNLFHTLLRPPLIAVVSATANATVRLALVSAIHPAFIANEPAKHVSAYSVATGQAKALPALLFWRRLQPMSY